MHTCFHTTIREPWIERRALYVYTLFMALVYSCPIAVQSYAKNSVSGTAFYKEITRDFLTTFDDSPAENVEKETTSRSFNKRYKIKISKSNDREIMATIMYHIYGKTPLVRDLFERKAYIWDPKTLRDLNITCGPEDNLEHHIINNLDTKDMPHSEGMGLLAKGVMPIHFGTSTSSKKEILKKQKIIRALEKNEKLRHALLKILGDFKKKHEKPFAAHYNRKHVLRTPRQLKRLERRYALTRSLSECPVLWLEFLKKWFVELSFVGIICSAFMTMAVILYQIPGLCKAIGVTNSVSEIDQSARLVGLPRPFKKYAFIYQFIGSVSMLISAPIFFLQSYYIHKETFSAYADTFYHHQRWYAMVQDIYALVQKNKKLARLCEELLENTSILIEDDHGDKELSHYLSLLETQNLSNFSIIFSFAGKLLKTIGLFEKCCQNEYLLGTIYEISTLAVYVHLAHYMACAKEYKNGLCYTKFVDPKKHPSTYINIKGLWNVGIAPNKAISNDVYMDGAQANLYFILGSNAGGKTTLAKILPVLPQTYGISPARKATQSIFHKVLTYFNIEDGNLVKGTSQYTSELDRIEYGLGVLDQEARDKNILWIVDEGAKGTGEDFAKVLLGELAKYVIEEYQNSGFIFITHYKDVRTMAKEFPRIENYTAIVDHVNEDQFVYTYKIKKGTPPLGEDLIIAVKILNKRPGFPPKLRERINSVIREKT